MPADLESQLADYSSWLAATYDLDVRPPTRELAAEEDRVEPRRDRRRVRPSRFRRLPVWVAVAASAAALAIGLVVVTGPDPTPTSSVAVDVADVLEVMAPPPEVLWRGSIGTSVGELGVEPCEACDPLRPWAPVGLADGRLLVADRFNGRWVLVDDGVATGTFTGDWTIDGQPVVVDGEVYAVGTPTYGSAAGASFSTLRYDPDRLDAPPVVVDVVPRASAGAAIEREVHAELVTGQAAIDVEVDGVTRRWRFPASWSVLRPGSSFHPMADGTVFVSVSDPNVAEPYLVQLTPDGTAFAYPDVHSSAWDGEVWIDEYGVMALEIDGDTFEVVRHRLASAADGLAGTVTVAPSVPATTSGAASGPVPACESLDGRSTEEVVDHFNSGGSCASDTGATVTPGQVDFSPCNDGTSLWWNDVGYGFMGADPAGLWTASVSGLPGEVWARCSAPADGG